MRPKSPLPASQNKNRIYVKCKQLTPASPELPVTNELRCYYCLEIPGVTQCPDSLSGPFTTGMVSPRRAPHDAELPAPRLLETPIAEGLGVVCWESPGDLLLWTPELPTCPGELLGASNPGARGGRLCTGTLTLAQPKSLCQASPRWLEV